MSKTRMTPPPPPPSVDEPLEDATETQMDAVEAVEDTSPESVEEVVEASPNGFIPIVELSGWCPNCNDKLCFDPMANQTVCPIKHPDCPRNKEQK